MSDDLVRFEWVQGDAWYQATLTLEQAAALKRGEAVAGREIVECWPLADLRAARTAAEDRLAAVEAEMAAIEWRNGMVDGAE